MTRATRIMRLTFRRAVHCPASDVASVSLQNSPSRQLSSVGPGDRGRDHHRVFTHSSASGQPRTPRTFGGERGAVSAPLGLETRIVFTWASLVPRGFTSLKLTSIPLENMTRAIAHQRGIEPSHGEKLALAYLKIFPVLGILSGDILDGNEWAVVTAGVDLVLK